MTEEEIENELTQAIELFNKLTENNVDINIYNLKEG